MSMSFLSLPSQIPTAMELVGLDASLRAVWATAVLLILLASTPIRCLGRVVATLSRRGKTAPSAARFMVPQKYFLHFYVVGVAWTTCLLASTWFYARGRMAPVALQGLDFSTVAGHLTGGSRVEHVSVERRRRVWSSVFLLLLMEAHVVRRLVETIYVFDYGNSARMHFAGYLTGLYFYVAAPLSLCSSFAPEVLTYTTSQVAELIIKGEQGMSITRVYWWGYVKPLAQLGWCQWIGASIFVWGWIHQLRCHLILGSLRQQPGTNVYVVPHGDWFEIVSCPHYLAEIVIYAGILLGSGGFDATVWLVFVFVASNLIFAAAQTHRWYHHKFENYPSSRRAILPMIY